MNTAGVKLNNFNKNQYLRTKKLKYHLDDSVYSNLNQILRSYINNK